MNRKKLISIGLLFLLLTAHAMAKTPGIIATIKPLHSLVVGVIGDTEKAELLLDEKTSPHNFQLKPSQMQMMQEARIIFYIDDSLETFLVRAFESLPNSVQKVSIARQARLALLPVRKGSVWESHDHGHEEHGHGREHERHHHDSVRNDMHVWLAPKNAEKMIALVVKELIAAYPANENIYKTNAQKLTERINSLDAELKAKLSPIQGRPFIVFHDAYQYLEQAYGLNCVGSITLEPHDSPSPHRIQSMREKLRQTGAACIFKEPQFPNRLITTVSEGFDIKIGMLDPLGMELPADENLYFKLLENMADNLRQCLQ